MVLKKIELWSNQKHAMGRGRKFRSWQDPKQEFLLMKCKPITERTFEYCDQNLKTIRYKYKKCC